MTQLFHDEPAFELNEWSTRGSLNTPMGPVVTVQDAIDLLMKVQDKNQPFLVESTHYCGMLSCIEKDGAVKMVAIQAGGEHDWDPPAYHEEPGLPKLAKIDLKTGAWMDPLPILKR